MLETLGVTQIEEQVYRHLLQNRGQTAAPIARACDLPTRQARAVLESLEDKGLVCSLAGEPVHYVAMSPDVALDGLIARQRRQMEHARVALADLMDDFLGAATNSNRRVADALDEPRAVLHGLLYVHRSARRQLRLLDAPPYMVIEQTPTGEDPVLLPGVRTRAIHDTLVLEMPGRLGQIRACETEARSMTGLPYKLLIADERLALVGVVERGEHVGALLVHHHQLVRGLSLLFEQLWTQATPITPASPVQRGSDKTNIAILRLLALGLKDEAIARDVGLGVRTVERRVRAMMADLHVGTRFQLGLCAAQLGWLDEQDTRARA